jgi:CRISPR/Cas system CSM-associated protein Csm3 (group 7 of RAMP superfamily)
MFGNTALASHFRISDAFPSGGYRTEERNGVAIDRVFGSVAVGPFNYETVTSGEFQTTLHIKNFSLAQLGLLSLALRDLAAERVRLGFGKSRGLGAVTARVTELTLRYPSCALDEAGRVLIPNGYDITSDLVGVGKFVEQSMGKGKAEEYGYKPDDEVALKEIPGYRYEPNEWDEPEIRAPQSEGQAKWEPLGRACAARWKAEAQHG